MSTKVENSFQSVLHTPVSKYFEEGGELVELMWNL